MPTKASIKGKNKFSDKVMLDIMEASVQALAKKGNPVAFALKRALHKQGGKHRDEVLTNSFPAMHQLMGEYQNIFSARYEVALMKAKFILGQMVKVAKITVNEDDIEAQATLGSIGKIVDVDVSVGKPEEYLYALECPEQPIVDTFVFAEDELEALPDAQIPNN
jgi:hypothetical protein